MCDSSLKRPASPSALLLALILALPFAGAPAALAQAQQPPIQQPATVQPPNQQAPAQPPPAARPVVFSATRLGVEYVDAASLATALGDVVTATDRALTWRGGEGVVTFFAGSSDALLQRPGNAGPEDWALSAPVLAPADGPTGTAGASGAPAGPAGGWLLPLDAVQLLGVGLERAAGEVRLHGPGGGVFALAPAPEAAAGSDPGAAPATALGAAGAAPAGAAPTAAPVADGWEMTEIAGAPALRFFASPDKSLLLLDLDLAPLAFPQATAEVDGAVAAAGSDHALLLIVSALSQQEWSSSLVFAQDGRSLEVRHPYRLRVYQGEPGVVGPGKSVAAVVLLPPSFSLYRPLSVAWEAIDATVTFRR